MASRFVGYVPIDGPKSADEAREWAEPTEVHPRWHRRWAEQGPQQEGIKTSATETVDTPARSFAGTPSTTKDIAEVLLAMDMLDMGWKEAEPKLLEARVFTNHSTFGRARTRARKDRLRSSQP
jgi:hypothetical protein